MQDNNIMISYKIQDVKIIKTKIIDGEYHIYGIRNNKKPGKDYRLKDYRTVKILIDVYDNMPVFLHLTKQRYICKITGKTITSSIGIVKKRCRISNRIKKRIETTFKDMKTFKQNAKENNVSISTVIRTLESIEIKKEKYDTSVIFIDEFKGNLGNEKYQLAVYDKHHKIKAQCQEWGYKNPLTRLVALFS